jgi:hypothetical protein
MWGKGNPIAAKWGSTKTETLADGLGQGNNIAHFPTMVQGAAAQFDLWDQHYTGMTLKAAISKWSGGNWDQPYADFLTKQTGLSLDRQVTKELLASAVGLKLMEYQARWEAGQPYPMTEAEWQSAQALVFGKSSVVEPQVAAATPAPNPTVEFAIKVPAGVNISVEVNGKTITP